MSQERLDMLVKRPAMEKINFWEECGLPCNADAHMVQDAINDQLRWSVDEDLWTAYGTTSWEPVGTCCGFEDRLEEYDSDTYFGDNDLTRQLMWSLLDIFATTDGLPHRSCVACHEIMDVTGPTGSELMILTGLMIVRMRQKAYVEHEVFPILMLSLYGSKGRIVQAHMAPEQQRLQVSYSELFDFRNLTKEWLDIFVRWFLNEPLAAPSLPSESSEPGMLEVSDDADERLVAGLSKSQENVSDVPSRKGTTGTPQRAPSRLVWSPGCNSEEESLERTGITMPAVLNAY